MHYTITDHQGSLVAYTGNAKEPVTRLGYDAWGRRRNAADGSYENVSAAFDRGYTGHEHLDAFGLINMNGRMYDPMLGRMLSPDIVVQQTDYTQSYNRYSYCFNNPLRFTDPSGYVVRGTSSSFRSVSLSFYESYSDRGAFFNTDDALGQQLPKDDWRDKEGNIIKDHGQIKVYIFYDPEAFETQTMKMYDDAIAKYGEGTVALSNTTTMEGFAQDWNDMASPVMREVNLNYHGSNQALHLDRKNNQYITSTGDGTTNKSGTEGMTNVQDLPDPSGNISKAILYINSCKSNSHTQRPLKGTGETLMESFANKFGFFIIRGTEAGVSYNRFTKHPEPQHRNEHWDSKFGKGQDPVIFKYHSF